ncbi:hypothetical protein CDIK_4024, partial [Cucumispora dikerogammari]
MIWRKLQSLSLSQNYLNNCNFIDIIRMFLNLTFVPSIRIVEEFNRLSSCIPEEYKIFMKQFLKYFQNSFIGSVKKDTLYEIEFWICNKKVHNNIPRSINSLKHGTETLTLNVEFLILIYVYLLKFLYRKRK